MRYQHQLRVTTATPGTLTVTHRV
uniref:Uncharacterized protein n=1 Tax=Rhizophora mucronata TaxID=61149 RepID=A0A2P2INH6_RHIMU